MDGLIQVTIRAPLPKVFLAAADLTRWPEFLPHCRSNRFLSQTPSGGVVKMSAVHAGIPISAVAQFSIDAKRRELRFTHLRSTFGATDGAEIVWTFEERPDGDVEVTIDPRFAGGWPVLGRLAPNRSAGEFLTKRLAEKTLSGLKRRLEAQSHAAPSRRVSAVPASHGKGASARKPKPRSRRAPADPPRKPARAARKKK